MDPAQAAEQLQEMFVLDVREPDEWAAGHQAEAVHIPMGEIQARVAEIPRGRTILSVCRVGGRSDRVAGWLRGQGYEVENLDGGLTAWAEAGLPLVNDEGNPGVVV